MTGAGRQLWELLALRWRMIRPWPVRWGLLLVLGLLLLLFAAVVRTVSRVDPTVVQTAVEVAPAAFAGFAALALVAPLTGGGGNQLFPADSLVAYPVRPSTHFLGGLLLAPANLIWVVQLLGLVAVTVALAEGGGLAPGLLTAGVYTLLVTAVGQGTSWLVHGLWQGRRGRSAVVVSGAALLLAAAVVVRTGSGERVLALTPAGEVTSAIQAGSRGRWAEWGVTTTVLALACVGALLLGARACDWALRRPAHVRRDRPGHGLARPTRVRSPLGELVALDRASVWRAPALRRGLVLLTLLPAAVAAGAALPWPSIVILPALVTAGAGLLFGINAFCLDGSGALFTAGLPVRARTLFASKTIVLTQAVVGSTALTVGAAALRAPRGPTVVELVAVATSLATCSLIVVALCLSSSVRHPHRAELRGVRDAVAPPGALALGSARLAVPTILAAIFVAGASGTGVWWLAPVVVTPAVLLSALSLWRSARRYADPVNRARVVQVVSAG